MAGKRNQNAVIQEDDHRNELIVAAGDQTPTKKVRLNVVGETDAKEQEHTYMTVAGPLVEQQGVVTPAGTKMGLPKNQDSATSQLSSTDSPPEGARRVLFPSSPSYIDAKPFAAVTPARKVGLPKVDSPAKRKLLFGRLVNEIKVRDNVRKAYSIVGKLTGSLGGNASNGPIYGELTMGSMQKMVNLMKEHTGFDSASRFIDVGSGIGKPNLHVAADPGVEFSYGIEIDQDRWLLGINCLKAVLDASSHEQKKPDIVSDADIDSDDIKHLAIGPRCIFEHGDIRKAMTFDPFTHVYMFSIGFPPSLWIDLSEMWNRSSSSYLICFHGPKDIIDSYGFNVELVVQTPTSMHGSKEGHMGYIYQRKTACDPPLKEKTVPTACDPAFSNAWDMVKSGLTSLRASVSETVKEKMNAGSGGPVTRASRRRSS